MRTILLIALLCSRAYAETPQGDPLWDAEVRMGYGVALGGGGGMTSTRATPLTLAALGSVLLQDEPKLSGYGGLTVETIDRNSVGTLFGVKLAPLGSKLRIAGGGEWIMAPRTLWGATASGGACTRVAHGMNACGDLQLTAFLAGTDLAPGHTVTQIQLTIGMVFDAL